MNINIGRTAARFLKAQKFQPVEMHDLRIWPKYLDQMHQELPKNCPKIVQKFLEAEANVAYLTPAKLQEEAIKSFYNNHKHTFGRKGELPGLVGLLNMDESNKEPSN